MVTLYGIANCDTIRKTRQWLKANNIDYHFHDYRKAGCDVALVREFLTHFDHEQLINRRGTTWRKLPEADRNNLTTDSAIRLMTANPSLIKRPLLSKDNEWLLGFDSERLQALLK